MKIQYNDYSNTVSNKNYQSESQKYRYILLKQDHRMGRGKEGRRWIRLVGLLE